MLMAYMLYIATGLNVVYCFIGIKVIIYKYCLEGNVRIIDTFILISVFSMQCFLSIHNQAYICVYVWLILYKSDYQYVIK